jgi:hypothetical protein
MEDGILELDVSRAPRHANEAATPIVFIFPSFTAPKLLALEASIVSNRRVAAFIPRLDPKSRSATGERFVCKKRGCGDTGDIGGWIEISISSSISFIPVSPFLTRIFIGCHFENAPRDAADSY